MATVSILNTTSNVSGKTLLTAENAYTITGLFTYDRDPNPPFAVAANSAVVPNLDADKVDGYQATQLAVLAETETVSAVWTFSAKPNINAGLQFPSSQASSADVNTLDDYEEGSWTPVIGGEGGTSGQSYTSQVGHYVKIGKLVLATFNVVLSAKGTITGNVQIQGLPFTSDTSHDSVGEVRWITLATTWVSVKAHLSAGATAATVVGAAAAATTTVALVTADIANTTQLVGTIIFRANN